jgi:hypothetical protein
MARLLTCIAALAVALTAACTSTTSGAGSRAQRSPSASASDSSQATDTGSAQPSDTAAPTTSSPADVAVPPPAQCPPGQCAVAGTGDLGNGYLAVLRSGRPTSNGFGSSIVELTHHGVAVYWHVTDDEAPGSIACKGGVTLPNCIVVDYLGAHASNATVWALSGGTLHKGATVTVDSPGADGRNLNGDDFVDAIGLQNDYNPDYATGHVQWQTWVSDGHHLTSTGCTALSATAPPRPTAPATGTCVH